MSEKIVSTTFVEKCLLGEANLEEIDDSIDFWHNNDTSLELHEFLGMSESEYDLWIMNAVQLPTIIKSHKEKNDVVRKSMPQKDLEPPKKNLGDHVHSTINALLNEIPGGGIVSAFFDEIIIPPLIG